MINRGRYNHLHLYEVTDQDLSSPTETSTHYKAGNVLIFIDKKMVELGSELAKADDIATAREYLANSETLIYERMQELEKRNRDLETSIRQRDGLLTDLSKDLRFEREMIMLLKTQLAEMETKLEVEALSRKELIDDLKQVSIGTQTVEAALEKSLEEKLALQNEISSQIVKLMELNMQNDDLKQQLDMRVNTSIEHAVSKHNTQGKEISQLTPAQTHNRNDTAQILTVSSGKQIHVYHEFSAPPARSGRAKASLIVRSGLRIIGILLIVVILFIILSVGATAYTNNVSFGEAFDLILKIS